MVKNRKWEKIEERCAFTPDRSLDWHTKAPYRPEMSESGAKDNITKIGQEDWWCICNGEEQKMGEDRRVARLKPDRSIDRHSKAPYTPKNPCKGG